MNIGSREIGPGHPPYIIAEAGVNHGGSVEVAMRMIEAARPSGVDAIKLQLFDADRLLSKAAKLAIYQKRSGADDPLALLRALQLPAAQLAHLARCAHDNGMSAIVSIFNIELVEEAQTADEPFDAYKTASTDIINKPLIDALIGTQKPLILSTGAAEPEEIAEASTWLGDRSHLFMQCVSSYPTPDEDARLAGREALMLISPHALGYSDHTTAVDTGAMAVAGGACLLEKHYTLDRNAQGPDHASSLDPNGLAEYVRLAHRAWRMRGPIEKVVSAIERDVRLVSRQSLTTTRRLLAGHVISCEDITIKRPGTGISPAYLDMTIGRTVAIAVEADMPLCEERLK